MADASKQDNSPWDEPDWIADQSGRSQQRPRGVSWAVFAVAGVVLLVGAFVAIRYARMQATQRALQAEMAALADAERAHQEQAERENAERLEKLADLLRPDPRPPRLFTEPVQDPAEALRSMAANPKALANFAQFHLELNEFDQAIEAFRKAAELDPCYADHLKMALKRQEQFDRTAPPPREVVKP